MCKTEFSHNFQPGSITKSESEIQLNINFRLEWEGAIRNGSTCLRTLEEEKTCLLRDLALKYFHNLNDFAPKLVQSVETLDEPLKNCSVDQDMHSIVGIRRHVGAEQLLPDFYAEDMTNLMNKDRRLEVIQISTK